MAKARSPWCALRPFLLAGAVTATWLALSASAATADSSPDSGSLLGGVTSTVSSLTAPLIGGVAPTLDAAPTAPSATGLLQPVVGSVASTADHLIAAVPVVNSVVPAGTVTSVAVPVAAGVDMAAGDLLETVAPPLTEAVPVLEPVLQPVVHLVDATVPPLPLALPDLSVDGIAVNVTAVDGGAADDAPGRSSDTALQLLAASSAPAITSGQMLQPTPESPLTGDDPSTPPAPAGPTSGAGSGASPSGPSGSAAWLDEFSFDLPLPGSIPVSGSLQHAPSPVSFDPGSSPD
ncbi:MAG TPA: hypothetical protein VIM40_11555 [Arthrobacter sp.]